MVLVWTAEDVRALATGRDLASTVATASMDQPGAVPGQGSSEPALAGHSGKYAPLCRWLRAQDGPELTVTFGQVEEVLGFPLPASSRHHVPHWHSYDGSAVARAIVDAGWKAHHVRLAEETVTLLRRP